jgi:hypothetical protein
MDTEADGQQRVPVLALRSREDLELTLWALSVGGYTVYPFWRSDTGVLVKWVWLSNVNGECAHWYVKPDGSDTPPLDDAMRERLRTERAIPMQVAAERARQRERALGTSGPCVHPFDAFAPTDDW